MADMMKSSPICLLSKASKTKSWLWHRCFSHLNFDTINQLAKQGLVKGPPKLNYTKDHLCSACQMGKSKKESHQHKPEPSINEKLQMLHMDLCGPMLRTKDEAPEIIIKFLKQAQVSLKATVRYLCTDNGTEFVNQTLRNYTEEVGITHNTSTVCTPQQNSIVERCNHILVEGARTMLIFSKSLLFLWAEDVAIACYTQNCSFIHTRYNKTPYELLRDRKPELKYLQVFGALCYPTNNFEDLGKLQPKAEIGIFIGYSPSKKALRQHQLNLLQRMIGMFCFNQCLMNTSNLQVLYTHISAATLLPQDSAGASSSYTSIDKDVPSLNSSSAESSSRIVDTSNMHTFQQPQINTKRWTKDHPLVTIIQNPSKPVSTRRQLATDALWCYFHAFLVKEEPKKYKEAMIESCWIEAMQEDIHEFEQLKV
ncbi:retrovirus-related pol polyprotein from transposon TNT 1-94 [Tanacetum coccineum]